MEIETPGRLPNIVTVDNITYTRFSRNKKISRVMTEFEWVRELNEGVKKIYFDMEEAGLPKPEYVEGPNTVTLILRNNIDERMPSRSKTLNESFGQGSTYGERDIERQPDLDELENQILDYLQSNGKASRHEICLFSGKSDRTIMRRLKHLIDLGLIKGSGNKYNPNRAYEIAIKNQTSTK